MLARDYSEKLDDIIKPVIVSHHMLMGMKEGQEKMSKSDPDSAIFMEDTPKDVERKVKKAFCPENVVANNPVMDYVKYIIFPAFNDRFTVSLRTDNGKVDKTYNSYEELEADYIEGTLHPSDLKPACAAAINKLLQPVRDHFANDPYARTLLETIKRW
jgi:tyrosyl-tRNA synthetase